MSLSCFAGFSTEDELIKEYDATVAGTNEIVLTALGWLQEERDLATATVISTWGSSPCPVGSQLLVDSAGNFAGSVSGGCVEGAVVSEALEVIAAGESRVLEYGVSNNDAWQVGLACGGTIKVWVTTGLSADLLHAIRDGQGRQQRLLLVSSLDSGEHWLVDETGDGLVHDHLHEPCAEAFRTGASRLVEEGGSRFFLKVYDLPIRLLVFGAVHIAQALVPMARMAGYHVTLIDARRAFASSERFTDVEVAHEWPDPALQRLKPDRRTAVVTLTHDPKFDEPALAGALDSDAFYVGALGSRRTHAQRLERLRESGVSEDRLERIHAPVGLDIGAATPAEIAVSIIAEITAALRRPAAPR